jgi:hypothetical protein
MKGILFSICIGSLTLALTMQGEQVQGSTNVDAKAKARSTARVHATSSTKIGASVSSTQGQHPKVAGTRVREHTVPQANASATTNRNMRMNRLRARHEPNVIVNKDAGVRSKQTFNESVAAQNLARIEQERNRAAVSNRESFRNRMTFSQAVTLHRHEVHDRDFWRRHFRIVIINNNAFFFDAGFWFPAWGYFPGAYYPYDGPIYAYNGLAPNQVVVNVQVELQRDGYYVGRIDGVLGPMTRHALAAFQADHGLAVTAAIDEATVLTLGLT